jgi:hypothetical protein
MPMASGAHIFQRVRAPRQAASFLLDLDLNPDLDDDE